MKRPRTLQAYFTPAPLPVQLVVTVVPVEETTHVSPQPPSSVPDQETTQAPPPPSTETTHVPPQSHLKKLPLTSTICNNDLDEAMEDANAPLTRQ